MAWCEQGAVDYVFGSAQNQRLRRKIAKEMRQAKKEQRRTGEPARLLTEFSNRRTRLGAGGAGSLPFPSRSPARRIPANW